MLDDHGGGHNGAGTLAELEEIGDDCDPSTSVALATVAATDALPVSREMVLGFETLHDRIPTMTDRELYTLYHHAAYFARRSWMVTAHILWEAKQRKEHANDGAIAAVAEQFGISPSNASGFIRVWEKFGREFARVESPYDHLVGISWYKTCAYTDDAHGWLARAATKKLENPAYSIRDLKADIEAERPPMAEGRQKPGPKPRAQPGLVALDGPPPASLADVARALNPAPAPARRDAAAAEEWDDRDDGEDTVIEGEVIAARALPVAPPPDAPPPARFRFMLTWMEEALDHSGLAVFASDPEEVAAELPPPSEWEVHTQGNLRQAWTWMSRVIDARLRLAGYGPDGRRAEGPAPAQPRRRGVPKRASITA